MSATDRVEKNRIYEANAASHDDLAATHDRNVPYIARRNTRQFYWDLLCRLAGSSHVWTNRAVLELGCGTGTYTDRVLAAAPRSFTGIDLSPDMLRRAAEKFPDPRCSWVCAPLEAFSRTSTQRFDTIFSFSFLHHLPDIAEGLDQIRRLLAPGGVYVALHEIILPKRNSFAEKLDDKLEAVFGAAARSGEPFSSRLWKALPGRLTRYRPAAVEPTDAPPDLVDYQLNKPFDLAEFAGPGIEVHGYCYLGYPWLQSFAAPINHRALRLFGS